MSDSSGSATDAAAGCGHACCITQADPLHDHFLGPAECPRCRHVLTDCPSEEARAIRQKTTAPDPMAPDPASSYDEVTRWLLANHLVHVTGHTWWSWSCQCGKVGTPTTQGRAVAGRDRHLNAQRRAYLAAQR